MTKECTLSIGKLPLGGFPKNSVVRINDHPNMTSAVYRGRKTLNCLVFYVHGKQLRFKTKQTNKDLHSIFKLFLIKEK